MLGYKMAQQNSTPEMEAFKCRFWDRISFQTSILLVHSRKKSYLRKVDMAARSTLLVWKSPSLHRRVALSSSGVEDR